MPLDEFYLMKGLGEQSWSCSFRAGINEVFPAALLPCRSAPGCRPPACSDIAQSGIGMAGVELPQYAPLDYDLNLADCSKRIIH